MIRGVVAVALVAGCGRYQFERRSDAAENVPRDDAPTCAFTFCDDFDRTDPVGDWDTVLVAGTGTGTVSNGVFTVTLSAEGDRYHLVKDLPAPTTSVTFSARISLTTTATGIDEVDLVPLNWLSGTCTLPFGFYLVRNSTAEFNLQETNGNGTCTGNRNNYYGVLDNTGPFDVRLTVLVGNPGTAKLELDGVEVHNRAATQVVPSAPLQIKLGGIVRDISAPWTITYENVIVDVN